MLCALTSVANGAGVTKGGKGRAAAKGYGFPQAAECEPAPLNATHEAALQSAFSKCTSDAALITDAAKLKAKMRECAKIEVTLKGLDNQNALAAVTIPVLQEYCERLARNAGPKVICKCAPVKGFERASEKAGELGSELTYANFKKGFEAAASSEAVVDEENAAIDRGYKLIASLFSGMQDANDKCGVNGARCLSDFSRCSLIAEDVHSYLELFKHVKSTPFDGCVRGCVRARMNSVAFPLPPFLPPK